MNSYFDLIDTNGLDSAWDEHKFPFSKYLFWDASLDTIDINLHKKFIVERVVTRGFLQDLYLLQKLYSNSEISDALKKSRVLDRKTANFCSFYFNIPLNELYVSPYYC